MSDETQVNSQDSSNPDSITSERGTLHKIFNPYTMSALVVGNFLWGYNIFRRVTRVLNSRYSNPVYQMRRPSSISNRLLAFKYFIIGGSILPVTFLAYVLYKKNHKKPSLNSSDTNSTNPKVLVDSFNTSFSKYFNNASVRLENLSQGVRNYVPESNFRNMGVDLKRDINKLKYWFSNIF